jgi:hypothetical protein
VVSTPVPVKLPPITLTRIPEVDNVAQETSQNTPGEILNSHGERRGLLMCDGKPTESEVIYWKIVPGDNEYESPITPHHGTHHDRYLTYEYDEGGWNNIRMGMECHIVMAHAMGRTLVVPAQQHLYLLGRTHTEADGKKRDEMGFEDFFDLNLLRGHKGFHVLSTKEFLQKEGCTGGLKGQLPPKNSSDIWGRELHHYLRTVADQKPAWSGRFLAMPNESDAMSTFNEAHFESLPADVKGRLQRFGGERKAVFYGKELQEAHHIHFQNGDHSRLLQHHYGDCRHILHGHYTSHITSEYRNYCEIYHY